MYFRYWDSTVIRDQLRLVTDSAVEPIGTSDVKRHINLPSTYYGDDDWIGTTITAARLLVERQINRALVHQTWQMVLNKFPGSNKAIEIPLPPLSSATTDVSVTYYNSTNGQTTLSATDYQIQRDRFGPSYLAPRNTGNWPATYARPDAITIQFVAGYGSTATTVPANVRHALKMLVGHWYENREAVGQSMTELPLGVQALLDSASWGNYV